MNAKWHISIDNNLVLSDNEGNTIIPTAQEIFFCQFKDKTEIRRLKVRKPSDEINFIIFSKRPIDLNVLLTPVTEQGSITIQVNIVGNTKGQQVDVSALVASNLDHVIIENKWYPFVFGAIGEINSILSKVGLEKPGRITLQQYLILKKLESPVVIDKLLEVPYDKGNFLSNSSFTIPSFNGTLYPYQNQGVRWLKMIVDENAGCILADEMGLGKTAQIIAVLTSENSDYPSLVAAPVSLLENWKREVQKFAPRLNVYIHQGNDRTGFYTQFQKYDLVITSYETILRDLSLFKMLKWNIVIADEAQAIKNPSAKRTKAIKDIDRRATIAVTGTPVENRLMDLWSITDFVFPDYLGNYKQFQDTFPDEIIGAERLEPLISPILLRRRVKEVAGDLPDRIVIPQLLKLSDEESIMYDNLRTEIIEEYGKQASLVSLIKLRMFCTHPLLQKSQASGDPITFGKYLRLIEILEEIIHNREKVIIFTSYSNMSDIMMSDLANRFEIYCDFIDGRVEVSERQQKIDDFSAVNNSAILILNPKAAGAGLNITAANHVIHYNLEWNPAVEDQASARAYRRGQTRPVTIHRLFYSDTVEDAINERLEIKRDLSTAAVVGTDGKKSDNSDILDALLRSPIKQGRANHEF
ncbi:DEAD/DEAH box helicase [Evansella clarkii]|uniref:DEAD/DEAH box helicase n=1 Tax=Evansella clarkii TaxID=79879 RepID=UPI000B441FB0|nr:DEAD/DEAH box helicase [Evansella clarkii]